MTVRARALAALQGLAIGDAMGMPTQLLSRADIARRFGPIEGFRSAPDDHPIAAGLPAGSVTDDTEQALLLAGLLIERNGRIDPAEWAARLADWEDDMRRRGSRDLLGPSTRAAIAAVIAGTPPEEAGAGGTTNGAAMRITPIGIAHRADDLVRLVDAVAEACRVSHDTGIAIAGAAAVAAAVSAGIGGAGLAEAVELAIAAARVGEQRGHWVAGASVAARIAWAQTLDVDGIHRLIGTSLASQESVPAAIGLLVAADGDGWAAVRTAAQLGGDTDTIGAMAGAIAGATGWTPPADAAATVERVNGLRLEPIVDGLLTLRDGA